MLAWMAISQSLGSKGKGEEFGLSSQTLSLVCWMECGPGMLAS